MKLNYSLFFSGNLYGGGFDGPERTKNENHKRRLQKIQRKCLVQEEGGHARGALPLITL